MNKLSELASFEQLDEYSRIAVDLILARFPAWREHVTFHHPSGHEIAFANFELTSPSPALERGLWVSTAAGEMTVGLHTHHSHFNDFEDRSNRSHIVDALDHAQALLEERQVVVSSYVGNRLVCSSAKEVAVVHSFSPLFSSVTRTTLRSWRGTYDRELGAGWKHG